MKTNNGTQWITVPTGQSISRTIEQVEISSNYWQEKHFKTIDSLYRKCKYYENYKYIIEYIFIKNKWESLSELNQSSIKLISDALGINTEFANSRNYILNGRKEDRLLNLLIQEGVNTYISGSAAKSYIDEKKFNHMGIKVIWKDFSSYPEYTQRFPPFEHKVSVLDLIFNQGNNAPYYIWGWRNRDSQ